MGASGEFVGREVEISHCESREGVGRVFFWYRATVEALEAAPRGVRANKAYRIRYAHPGEEALGPDHSTESGVLFHEGDPETRFVGKAAGRFLEEVEDGDEAQGGVAPGNGGCGWAASGGSAGPALEGGEVGGSPPAFDAPAIDAPSPVLLMTVPPSEAKRKRESSPSPDGEEIERADKPSSPASGGAMDGPELKKAKAAAAGNSPPLELILEDDEEGKVEQEAAPQTSDGAKAPGSSSPRKRLEFGVAKAVEAVAQGTDQKDDVEMGGPTVSTVLQTAPADSEGEEEDPYAVTLDPPGVPGMMVLLSQAAEVSAQPMLRGGMRANAKKKASKGRAAAATAVPTRATSTAVITDSAKALLMTAAKERASCLRQLTKSLSPAMGSDALATDARWAPVPSSLKAPASVPCPPRPPLAAMQKAPASAPASPRDNKAAQNQEAAAAGGGQAALAAARARADALRGGLATTTAVANVAQAEADAAQAEADAAQAEADAAQAKADAALATAKKAATSAELAVLESRWIEMKLERAERTETIAAMQLALAHEGVPSVDAIVDQVGEGIDSGILAATPGKVDDLRRRLASAIATHEGELIAEAEGLAPKSDGHSARTRGFKLRAADSP